MKSYIQPFRLSQTVVSTSLSGDPLCFLLVAIFNNIIMPIINLFTNSTQ